MKDEKQYFKYRGKKRENECTVDEIKIYVHNMRV